MNCFDYVLVDNVNNESSTVPLKSNPNPTCEEIDGVVKDNMYLLLSIFISRVFLFPK